MALEDLGFDRVRSYNYHAAALSAGKTAYTFGLKTVLDEAGSLVHLAAVIIRGTGSYTEWAGNLNVGEGRDQAQVLQGLPDAGGIALPLVGGGAQGHGRPGEAGIV